MTTIVTQIEQTMVLPFGPSQRAEIMKDRSVKVGKGTQRQGHPHLTEGKKNLHDPIKNLSTARHSGTCL